MDYPPFRQRRRVPAQRKCHTPGARLFLWLSITLATLFAATAVHAGGGPENVFLVVNARSWSSRTVANHYAELRSIPTTNILFLDWPGSLETIKLATFREKILGPIVQTIENRGIAKQIDYIVYSTDFPYAIDFSAESKGAKFSVGSITGLTYFYDMVMNQTTGFIGRSNWYADTRFSKDATRAFSNSIRWDPGGKPTEEPLSRKYLLSTMLGYTSGRGNSVEEVVAYLKSAAGSDGKLPRGTVYFVQNEDIRSKARHSLFDQAARTLTAEGSQAEVVNGVLPTGKRDVLGAMVGKAKFDWEKSRSQIVPGAICDHFTSFGGILRESASQTPLSEFLRFGAAAASGTVIEPYAILAKFPHPMLHVHYHRGCSLAESFYQSVAGPYQLLIVGDPLCRPFARIPQITVRGVFPNDEVTGEFEITPSSSALSAAAPIDQFQLFIDGRRRGEARPGASLTIDTAGIPDGYHELRIVGVTNDPIQTHGHTVVPIRVNNRGRRLQVKLLSPPTVRADRQVQLQVAAPGSERIIVFNRHISVADTKGDSAVFTIDAENLGMGPVSLMVAGIGKTKLDNVFAKPVAMTITPPSPQRPRGQLIGESLKNGVRLTLANRTSVSVDDLRKESWLKKAGVKANEPFIIQSTIQVPRDGLYQFQGRFRGQLAIKVNSLNVLSLAQPDGYSRFETPVHLTRGNHEVTIAGKSKGTPKLQLKFGDRGTRSPRGPTFRHVPPANPSTGL